MRVRLHLGRAAKWTVQEPITIADAPALSLCVVNYNGARYLPATLGAVRAVRDRFRDVLLLDNGSTDDSLAIARHVLPDLTLVPLGENRGPGSARNAGMQRASCDRILFIDNDVMLHPGCPAELQVALDRNPDAVMVLARVLFENDRGTVQFDGAGSHFIGLMTLHHGGASLEDLRAHERAAGDARHPTNGSMVSACFLVDRARWGVEPLFDDGLFMYLEDHEAGLRARLLGHEIVTSPAALCFHGVGTPGISIRESGSHSSLRVQQTIQNRWALLLKLYSLRSLMLLSPALAVFELFQLLGALKKGWLREWVRAAGSTIRGFQSLSRRRRAFQARRRLADGAVLEGGPIPFNLATRSTRLERAAGSFLDAATGVNWRLVHRWLGGRQRAIPTPSKVRSR